MAIVNSLPLADAAVSLIKPWNTVPNPPFPNTLSVLKFLVAALSSAKVKTLKFAASKICPLGNSSSSLILEDWLFSEPQRDELVLFPVENLLLKSLLVPPEWLLRPREVELPFCINFALLKPEEN